MLTDNVIEFMNYKNALKGNYRKGVHTMRCILENPAQAADFAASVGAVSVVFGVPVDKPDRNSDELLELVLNSSVCDKATLTFLSQFYPENAESYDTMMNSAERCAEIFATPILWRPVGRSNCLTAKLIVTMAGLNCVDYGDLAAVVSSSVAMTAVAASQTAMAAVAASSTAMTAVAASQTAMTAVAASPTAMAAIWQSSTAVQVVQNNATAWSTFTGASSSVIGKTVAILSGLDPYSYADMTAVAASQTAMAAVAASSTAMAAVAASSTAMAAVIANSTALNAVVSSSTAMAAVAASPTAMAAIWQSSTAVQAVQNNATAWSTFTGASSSVIGKTVAILSGLDPNSYADMTAVAASQTAMAAVAASSTAMTAVAASQTAMTAVAASATARGAVTASSTALAALEQSPLISEVSASSFNGTSYTTVYTGLCFIVAARRSSGSNTFIFNNTYTGSSTTTGASSAKTIGATNSAINLFATGVVVKLESSNSPSSNAIYFRIIKCG